MLSKRETEKCVDFRSYELFFESFRCRCRSSCVDIIKPNYFRQSDWYDHYGKSERNGTQKNEQHGAS